MVKYETVKRLIRFKLKDNNEIQFSDYDIMGAVNECIRYLNKNYAIENSDFLEKVTVYDEAKMNAEIAEENAEIEERNAELDEDEEPEELLDTLDFKTGGAELPEDFLSLVSVMRMRDGVIMRPVESIRIPRSGEYKVFGDRIYCGDTVFKLLYKGAIEEVTDDEDEIQLPFIFKDTLVKLSIMILQNAETDILMDAMNDAALNLIPRRRYRNVRIRMPFRV